MDHLFSETLLSFITLTGLEIVLGIDNIVFISILAGRLPAENREKARKLGLMGALVTRLALLSMISWIARLTTPLFSLAGHEITGKSLLLLVGGVFLLFKATRELHHKLEGEEEHSHSDAGAAKARDNFASVIVQIMLMDMIFSIDSVITAVGMAPQLSVMVAANVAALIVMVLVGRVVGDFVEKHPTVKVLALSFLLMIGLVLVADGMSFHIPKGYVYFAMGFSVLVEFLNLKLAGKSKPVHLRKNLPGLLLILSALGSSGALAQRQQALQQQQGSSDFLSLCKEMLKGTSGSGNICLGLHKAFFSQAGMSAIAPIRPTQVNAQKHPIDAKIQYIIFNDPNYIPGVAYCYFLYRGWIDPAKISPDFLALASTGFSILNEEIPEYQNWVLNNPNGKACRALVEKESQVPLTDLAGSLKGYSALIGLSPLGAIKNGAKTYKAIVADMTLTLNHERVHAYQVMCPQFEQWSIQQWKKLSAADKAAFQKQYPSYNWADLKVAGREYVAFSLETSPEKLLKLAASCKVH